MLTPDLFWMEGTGQAPSSPTAVILATLDQPALMQELANLQDNGTTPIQDAIKVISPISSICISSY